MLRTDRDERTRSQTVWPLRVVMLSRQPTIRLGQDADDVEQLVLLTETAEKFFRAIGYEVIDRRHVPQGIKQSAEFRSLCPASAVCMSKLLTSSRARVSHG